MKLVLAFKNLGSGAETLSSKRYYEHSEMYLMGTCTRAPVARQTVSVGRGQLTGVEVVTEGSFEA